MNLFRMTTCSDICASTQVLKVSLILERAVVKSPYGLILCFDTLLSY